MWQKIVVISGCKWLLYVARNAFCMWPEMIVVCGQKLMFYMAKRVVVCGLKCCCMWPEKFIVGGHKLLLYVARNDYCMWPGISVVCVQK